MFHAKLTLSIMFDTDDLAYEDQSFLVDGSIDCIDQMGLNDCTLYNAREYGALDCVELSIDDEEEFKETYHTLSVDQFKQEMIKFVAELQRQAELEDQFE